MAMASSSASELQAAASRRKEASGAAQRGRTADSRSKTTYRVLVFARDEASARRLALTKVHFHSPLG